MNQTCKFAFLGIVLYLQNFVAFSGESTAWSALCDTAESIIEGDLTENGNVKIRVIYKKSPRVTEPDRQLQVLNLERLDRMIVKNTNPPSTEKLAATSVILFLGYDKEAQMLTPVGTRNHKGSWGSLGVIWYDTGGCYVYGQSSNPGPLRLFQSDIQIAAIRKKIENSLAKVNEWRLIVSIADPQLKAGALAKYLAVHSSVGRRSPTDRDDKAFYFRVRDEFSKLGKVGVDPVVGILKNAQPDEDLNQAVLIVSDFGSAAKDALPFLIKLLQVPAQARPEYVLAALESIGDSKAIPDIRRQLASSELNVRASASRVLAGLNDLESYNLILKALPEGWTQQNEFHVRDMLNALWHLDPKLAEPLIGRAESDPNLADIKDQLRRWDHKPPPKPPEEKF